MQKKYIISGIGTEVGKTVVSAIVSEALSANYWKPIQAGDLDNSDSIKIGRYTTNVTVLEEQYRLTSPMSPHAAARIDGVEIEAASLNVPSVEGNLVIEGAGGLLVPMNDEGLTFADVFGQWDLPVIIVSRHYLGSINHTLLTAEVMKNRGIKVAGIIFVGDENKATEEVILTATGLTKLGRVPMADEVNQAFVSAQAAIIREKL